MLVRGGRLLLVISVARVCANVVTSEKSARSSFRIEV